MNRSRLIFVVIVGVALVVVLAGVFRDQLGGQGGSTGQNSDKGPIEISVAVNPLAEAWVKSAVQSFNGQRQQVDGREITIALQVQDGLPIWTSPGQWSMANHPLVWIPEITQAVEFGNETGLKYSVLSASLASTVMMWGAPADRAQVLKNQYGALDWKSVQQATSTTWDQIGGEAAWGRFIKPGFAQPDRYTSGMAAALVGVAEVEGKSIIDSAAVNDPALSDWFKPVFQSVPNFATLGAHPAQTIASRGVSAADVALLAESEWLVNYRSLTTKVGPLTLVYPAYQFWFDFPFAVWDSPEVTAPEHAAAQQFLDFLLSSDQQRRAAGFGLRQADGTPAVSDLFQQAVSAGVVTTKPDGQVIQLMLTRGELVPFVNRNWTAF
jgi:hypothetical protein